MMKDIYSNKAYDIYINKRDELIESKEFQDLVVKNYNKQSKENIYKANKMLRNLLREIESKYGEIDPVEKHFILEMNPYILYPGYNISLDIQELRKKYYKAVTKRYIDRIKYFFRIKRRNS